MSLDLVSAITFKNFCYRNKKTWCNEQFEIKGKYKEENNKEIFKETFLAHKVLGCSVEGIYKLYIEWFNVIRRPNEKNRIFISAEKGADK